MPEEKPIEQPRIEMAPKGEEDVSEIKSRIEQLGSNFEKKESAEKQDIAKKQIREYIKEVSSPSPSSSVPLSKRDEAKEISKFPETEQINMLVSLVFEKGLKEAVSIANAMDNPAILDEFHDVLIDRYFEELLKRGIIKL